MDERKMIYLDDALDILDDLQRGYENGFNIYADSRKQMLDLSSAQEEIIRCEDCRWWDKSKDSPFGYCMAMKHVSVSANWKIGIYRRYKGDFYCADAERRTDG